jgi:tRNA(fMet)-specific endonuclease VapC
MKYLLDTNILSEAIKPIPSINVLNRLQQHRNEIGICSPVWHELLFGAYRLPVSAKREKLERYLYQVVRQLPILPSFIDGQIAAIAKVNQLVLVTANVKDYDYFPEVVVENWFSTTF